MTKTDVENRINELKKIQDTFQAYGNFKMVEWVETLISVNYTVLELFNYGVFNLN